MAQAAHDFSLFEENERPAPKKKAQLRSVKGGAVRSEQLRRLGGNFRIVLAATLFLTLAVSLLQSKATLNELTTEIQRTQSQLTTEQSTNNYLNSELNGKTSMANVEEVANRLGLMKMDESQITYVRLEESSVLTRKESDVKRWTEFLYSGLLSLAERLDF